MKTAPQLNFEATDSNLLLFIQVSRHLLDAGSTGPPWS